MADQTTPNYGLTQPEVGGSVDTWGSKLNTNMSLIDTQMEVNETAADDAQTDATQGIADAATAQTRADLCLPKDGSEAMTGEVEVLTSQTKFEALGSVSGTVDLDCDVANYFQCDLTGTTTFTISNATPTAGYVIVILLEVAAAGETVNWPAGIDWAYGETAPELSAAGTDVIALITLDGTNWLGSVSMPDVR